MRTNDSNAIAAPEVTLRIPGTWSRPEEFYQGLPRGCRCTAEALVLFDGSEFEFNVLPADEQFPRNFAGSCPKLPTESERDQVENFKVNICLTGRGGDIDAAQQLMAGAAAVLAAGEASLRNEPSPVGHRSAAWSACRNGSGQVQLN